MKVLAQIFPPLYNQETRSPEYSKICVRVTSIMAAALLGAYKLFKPDSVRGYSLLLNLAVPLAITLFVLEIIYAERSHPPKPSDPPARRAVQMDALETEEEDEVIVTEGARNLGGDDQLAYATFLVFGQGAARADIPLDEEEAHYQDEFLELLGTESFFEGVGVTIGEIVEEADFADLRMRRGALQGEAARLRDVRERLRAEVRQRANDYTPFLVTRTPEEFRQRLQESQIDVNEQDQFGNLLLTLVARSSGIAEEIGVATPGAGSSAERTPSRRVEILLDMGVNPTLRNRFNEKASEICGNSLRGVLEAAEARWIEEHPEA